MLLGRYNKGESDGQGREDKHMDERMVWEQILTK
jgi:hypothetical protein